MEKASDYRVVICCPTHGTSKGFCAEWTPKGTTEKIPCFKCNACKKIYLDPINDVLGDKKRSTKDGYKFWNIIGPCRVPDQVFIYDKQTEKGLCACPGKLKKKTRHVSHFLMDDGTTRALGGAKVCLSCGKFFISFGTYQSQKAFYEKYNIEVVFPDGLNEGTSLIKEKTIETSTQEGIKISKTEILSVNEEWENEVFETEDFEEHTENLSILRPANRVASAYYDAKISFNPYQYLPWLKVFMNGSNNLLISDEVGLGKTIEAGILIKEQLTENVNSKIVIVCPAFLREKWYQELSEKFFLDSQIYDGKTMVDFMTNIVVLPISRIKQYLENERNFDFSMVVIDEVHYFKNAKSARYGYLKKFLDKIGESKRIFMSATPINNSGNDYHSIERLFTAKSDRTNTTKKQAYINLPDRHIEDIYVDLTEEEQNFYNATDVLDPFSGTIYRHIGASCLYALGRYAYSGDELTSETKEELRSSLEALLDGRNVEEIECDYFQQIREMAIPKTDSKIQKLKEIIRSYAAGVKIVLFSHYIETVKYLHSELSAEFNTGYIYANTISNNIKCRNIKNKFEDAKNWFSEENDKVTVLICSDTCREGIDLDMANVLINYDLPFNPSILEQRIGRIDRMSQTKDMYIYNFHVNETYDDRLHFILSAKLRFINFYATYNIGNPLNITPNGNHTFDSFIKYFESKSDESRIFAFMSDDDFSVAARILRKIGVKIEKKTGITGKEMQRILIEKLNQHRILIEKWFDEVEIKKITEDQLYRQKETLEKLLNFPKNISRSIIFDDSTLQKVIEKANSNPQFRKRISTLIKDYDKKLSDMEVSGMPMVIKIDDLEKYYCINQNSLQSSVVELLRNEGAKIYELS